MMGFKFIYQMQVQEWLYMDGEDAQATEFKDRLESLKAIGDPIFFRWVIQISFGIPTVA